MKNIFVTGGTGFLGSHLLEHLIREDCSIFALYRSKAKLEHLFFQVPSLEKTSKVKWIQGDLFSSEWSFEEIDVVYHLAGFVGYKKEERKIMEKVNVEGTREVLRKIKKAGSKAKLIHLSSVVTIGAGLSSDLILDEESKFNLAHYNLGYFETKKKAEELVLREAKKGLFTVCLNPSTIYGARDMEKSSRSAQLSMAKGKLSFYPAGGVSVVYVGDVCKALIAAPIKAKSGSRYILSGDNITIFKLLSEIASQCGVKPPRFKIHKTLLLFAGFSGDILSCLGIKTGLGLEQLRVVTMYHWFSHKKAEKYLDFNPISYKKAIKESLTWAKKEKII